jgi:hypothetical protein
MADFNFSDVASKVQPPPQMSLADMVNLARGAQAYQQAGQINPLALRQQLAETEFAEQQKPQLLRQSAVATKLAEETLDPKIKQQLAQTLLAETQAKSGQLKLSGEKLQNVLNISSARASDREVLGLSQLALSQDSKTASEAKKRLHQLNAEDFQTAIKSGLSVPEALEAFGHITAKIDTAPNQLPNLYQNATRIGTGAQGLLTQQAPATTSLATGQVGQVNPLQGTITPMSGYNPGSVFELNGVKYQMNEKGVPIPVGQESTTPLPTGAPSGTPQGAPSMKPKGILPEDLSKPKPRFEPLVQEDMKVPNQGIVQLNTQQKERYDEGDKEQKAATELAQTAEESKQTTRQIKKNIQATAGSAPEKLLRNGKQWVAGNEELDKLVKNLADNQLRQAKLMGLDTVHEQSVSDKANGSENITSGALRSIVDRAEATTTAFDKYSKSLDKYIESKGTYNGRVNVRNFKRAWKDNYDPRIFMIQNINQSNLTDKAKQNEIEKVLSDASDKEIERLTLKSKNIKRLEKGDF